MSLSFVFYKTHTSALSITIDSKASEKQIQNKLCFHIKVFGKIRKGKRAEKGQKF